MNFVKINELKNFSVYQTFDCGQCFRFDPVKDNADGNYSVEGVAFGKYVRFEQPKPDTLIIHNSTEEEYENIWKHYLSLDTDYDKVKSDIAGRFKDDIVMSSAMEQGSGIRILRQDPWETVCSFIISQNNNIPRIKKIIAEMSRVYGERIEENYYAFPTPESLVEAGIDGLTALKTGFRAKYIYDAASRVCDGRLDLDKVMKSDTETALTLLQEVKGIGLKVASCSLLFGFNKTDVFPVDVWIKRVLEKYYPDGLDLNNLGEYAGIIQQYLFYYERYNNGGLL